MVIISGLMFQCSAANILPVRQKPVITSSSINSTLWSVKIFLTIGKYSSGGEIAPPQPCTGSAIKTATVPTATAPAATSKETPAEKKSEKKKEEKEEKEEEEEVSEEEAAAGLGALFG